MRANSTGTYFLNIIFVATRIPQPSLLPQNKVASLMESPYPILTTAEVGCLSEKLGPMLNLLSNDAREGEASFDCCRSGNGDIHEGLL